MLCTDRYEIKKVKQNRIETLEREMHSYRTPGVI